MVSVGKMGILFFLLFRGFSFWTGRSPTKSGKEKNSLRKNLNFYVVGIEKEVVGDGTDVAIFHLLNNLI